MRTAARRYRTLLTAPGVRTLYASSLIGRLPVGMGMLLFVLVVHAGTGSYTIAGLAAATNAAATALCGPPLGRLSDRGHASLILVLTGLAQAVTLVGLVIALKIHLDGTLIIGIGGLAGIVNPPVAAVTRTVLPRLAPDDRSRRTAFALDALLVEMTFVIGPALVGIVSAIWDGYDAAILAAVFNVVGSFGLAAAKSVRQGYGREARIAHAARPVPTVDVDGGWRTRWRRLIGPLASGGLRVVLIVSVLEAAAFGVLEVAIPAYTNARGLPQAGGLLFAVWSGGSIVGGLWFGGQDFRWPLGRQYALLMALNVIGFGSVLLAGGPVTLGALLFFAGLFISPTTAVEAALVTELAPPENTTEAFTWSGTAIYLGFALGSGLAAVALSGSLGSTSALTTATLLAIGLSAAGTLATIIGRRSLRATPRAIAVPA
jgi:MFS family permease